MKMSCRYLENVLSRQYNSKMSCRYLENVLSRQDNSKTIPRCLEDVLCRLGSLFIAERNCKVTAAVNFIPSKFGSLPQGDLKIFLHIGSKVYRESLRDSWFVTNNVLVYFKLPQTRCISSTNLIFPQLLSECVSKQYSKPIQNNMHCWWIEIKERPKYTIYDNIRDLSETTFWYHSNDTKRNPWVMLCSHCPINDPSGYLHNTVYLAVMLQASWHTAEGN